MRLRDMSMVVLAMAVAAPCARAQTPQAGVESHAASHFHWADGKRAAVSLSFDDSRLSQVDTVLAVL